MSAFCKQFLIFYYLLMLYGCSNQQSKDHDYLSNFSFKNIQGEYFVAPRMEMSVSDVVTELPNFRQKLPSNELAGSQAVLQHFELTNRSNSEKTLILVYKYNIIHHLEAYTLPTEHEPVKVSGIRIKPEDRDLKNWKLGFSFTFKPNEQKSIFIRSTTFDRINLSNEWLSPERYEKQIMQNLVAQNLFYGVMLVLILYNFFLYLSTRLQFYFLYSIFALFTLFTLVSYDGYFNYLFWTGEQSLWQHHGIIFMHLMVIMAVWFCNNLMNLYHQHKLAYYFARGFMVACFISLCLCLTSYKNLGLLIFDTMIILGVLLIVGVSLKLAYKGSKLIKIFILSWIVLLVSGSTALLMINDVVPHNTFLSFVGHFGIGFEMIITSFLIGFNLKVIKNEKELATQKAQAKTKEAGNLRNLVHILCHDINNPLAIIGGYSQSLNKKYDEKKSRKAWKKIHMAFEQIKDITAAVRELQANELNKKPLKINSIDLHKIIESAKFIFEQKLKEKNLSLESNITSPNLFKVMAEEISLSHNVINNILSNAIKFSPANSRIIINALELTNSNEIEISIQDFGIGMPKKLCESLFNLEHKTNRIGTAGEKGTGFGLPLVKSFVELYHGKVHVESYPQEEFPHSHGTVFKIILHKAS